MATPPYRQLPFLDGENVSLPWYRFFQQEAAGADISGLEAQIAAAAAAAAAAQATASTALADATAAQDAADQSLLLALLAVSEAG